MRKRIIVLHAKDTSKVSHMTARRPFTWLYLGQDIKQRENISHTLGKGNRYFIGNLLQEVASQEKQPFLNYIAELGLYQKNKRHWWASNIAHKSPLASDFFLLWCYAAIFERVCFAKEWDKGELFIVFVQDRWLYRYLGQRHGRDGLQFLSRKSTLPEAFKLIARGIAGRGYFLVKARYETWRSKSIRDKILHSAENKREIYLCSWIEERFFKKNGGFEDAYLGRLREIIKDCGLNVTYVTLPFLGFDLKKKCLGYDKCSFIFPDRYIGFRNMLKSLFSFIRISFPMNLDSRPPSLRTLVQREMIYEISGFASNVLYYFAFGECLKRIGQREITIIYPFENQPWDRMLCLAAKESDKDIKLIGYQHSMVPSLLLNYFLGSGESSIMPLPDCIVANSEYTLNLLKSAGYGETELVNGGALRYEYLHKTERYSIKKNEAAKAVLVALPGSRTITGELLVALFEAFRDLTKEKFRFMLKFHPDMPLSHLGIQLPPRPAHFQIIDKPISEILRGVDLVIYSSSTSGLEALISGVPVIRYCSEHVLDLDPLGDSGGHGVESCSESNLKEVILSALRKRRDYLIQELASAGMHLDNFLSPVDEGVWRRIIENEQLVGVSRGKLNE